MGGQHLTIAQLHIIARSKHFSRKTIDRLFCKVNEAEREKAKSEQEHKRRASRYAELEGRIQLLEKKYTKSIRKAK